VHAWIFLSLSYSNKNVERQLKENLKAAISQLGYIMQYAVTKRSDMQKQPSCENSGQPVKARVEKN